MAITVTSPQADKAGWIKNAISADASGTEEIIAAPAAGTSHYIRSISINSAATISVTIGAGETTSAVTAALIGPVNLVAGATANFVFSPAMQVGAATALTVDASGAGAICVVAQGETY